MKDLICSKDVREYVEKIGYEFSDIEKVVLIMHNGQSLTKQHQLLLQLEKTTADEKLKKKIQTKINYDTKCIQKIQTSAPDEIFMLEVPFEDENDEGKIREYFILFDDAFNCALGAMRDFTISKIKLHRGKTQWDEDDFDDGIIEYIKYKEGEPVWYWGSNFEGVKYDDDDENFETIEIPIPHPFEKGDMIRIVGTDDYGIVVEYGEGGEYELDGVGKVNKHESITIELVDENALFSHFHVLPSELEHANLPESDPLRELLRIAGYMSQGYSYLQGFQMACEKYLESMKTNA